MYNRDGAFYKRHSGFKVKIDLFPLTIGMMIHFIDSDLV